MEKKDVLEIANDCENKPNKDLLSARDLLIEEFEKTKELVISLTRHMDAVENIYNKINNEIKKRNIR